MRRSFISPSLLLALFLAAPSLAAGLPRCHLRLAFSPDGGKVLVSMDTDGAPNAYALPVDGGAPVQLTRSAKDPVWALSYFPADERVLYRSGPAGDEDHLFVRGLNGKAVGLVPGKTSRFVGWAGDGHGFWIEIANAGSQSRDLYKVATEGYAWTLIDRNGSDVSRFAASLPTAASWPMGRATTTWSATSASATGRPGRTRACWPARGSRSTSPWASARTARAC